MEAVRISTAFILLALAVTACAEQRDEQARLTIACALKECECLQTESGSLFVQAKVEKVQWEQSGNAYCPEGFSLREVAEKRERLRGGIPMPRYGDTMECKATKNSKKCHHDAVTHSPYQP